MLLLSVSDSSVSINVLSSPKEDHIHPIMPWLCTAHSQELPRVVKFEAATSRSQPSRPASLVVIHQKLCAWIVPTLTESHTQVPEPPMGISKSVQSKRNHAKKYVVFVGKRWFKDNSLVIGIHVCCITVLVSCEEMYGKHYQVLEGIWFWNLDLYSSSSRPWETYPSSPSLVFFPHWFLILRLKF